MTAQTNLEIKGILREHSLAELIIEIAHARLTGSLRLSGEAQKTVVYFDAGEVVFAVSNARAFRLFEILLQENKTTKEQLMNFPDFTNDFLLGQNLIREKLFTKSEIDRFFVRQIQDILRNNFEWQEGEWNFSPLVRVRGDIRFKIESRILLIEYARQLSNEAAAKRFKDLREFFSLNPAMPVNVNLTPQESFVFSRFENSQLLVSDVINLSGLSEHETLKILYTLWLGGFLNRQRRHSAFTERKATEILSANISLVKGQKAPAISVELPLPKIEVKNPSPIETPFVQTAPELEKISLEEYLGKIEKAANYYEILDIDQKAGQEEIKQAYFSLAKRFHPDLFHKEIDAQLQQSVQKAFSKLAQAYDTLRHEKNREVYNFKMRKDLEVKERIRKTHSATENANLQNQPAAATNDFEQGFSLLMDDEFEAALPFLARAVHLANDNARYHAYYGKALASVNNQQHKAESELQTAVKLAPDNPDYRIMLAEFFIQIGLSKRAEGVLNRLRAISPNHEEARILLDTLRIK